MGRIPELVGIGHYAPVAQSGLEQRAYIPCVGGSNPSWRTHT